MKIKLFFSLLLAGGLVASAQSQGYKDGIEYYKAGQYNNAKEILERTLNQSGTDQALANYYLGQVALAQGDKAAAKSYFEKGLSLNAENAYNYVGVGALDLLNGQLDAAKEQFKQAEKLGKKNADISVSIARAYYNGDPVAYAKDIQKYIDKARKDSKNAAPSIYVLEGDMLVDKADYGAAASKYENAIINDPANSEGYVKYANAYFYVNKQFAIQKLEELLQQQPNSAMAQRELAEKYFKGDYWRKASDLYGKYIQNPNHFPEDKARYAVLLYWGEKYPESYDVAGEVLNSNPKKNDKFLMERVRFLDLTKMEKFPEAVAAAEKFFKDNAGDNFTTNDYVTYADALSGNGQDSLAMIQYELAAEKDPQNGDLLKNLSAMYDKNKEYAKAADAYGAYLKLQENPSLNDLYGMSGRYLNAAATATDSVEAKELADRGIEYINQVIDRAADKIPAFYQRLANLNIAGNNKKPNAAAIEAYDKVIELLNANPANMDPANSENQLRMYWQAYAFKAAYASMNGEKELAKEYNDKATEIKNLMSGGAQ